MWSTGFGAIILGITTNTLGVVVFEGLARGLVMGLGAVLILTGIVLLASTLGWIAARARPSEVGGWWLPSRDGDR